MDPCGTPVFMCGGYKWQQSLGGTPLECHVTAKHGLMIKIMPRVCHMWPAC